MLPLSCLQTLFTNIPESRAPLLFRSPACASVPLPGCVTMFHHNSWMTHFGLRSPPVWRGEQERGQVCVWAWKRSSAVGQNLSWDSLPHWLMSSSTGFHSKQGLRYGVQNAWVHLDIIYILSLKWNKHVKTTCSVGLLVFWLMLPPAMLSLFSKKQKHLSRWPPALCNEIRAASRKNNCRVHKLVHAHTYTHNTNTS